MIPLHVDTHTQRSFLPQAVGAWRSGYWEPSNQKTREREKRRPSEKGSESEGSGPRQLGVCSTAFTCIRGWVWSQHWGRQVTNRMDRRLEWEKMGEMLRGT